MIAGLHTQVNVVGALLLRETRTRFGAHQLGYLWALVAPLSMILMFAAMIEFGGRSAPDGMSGIGFIATGMVPYTLFQSTLGQAVAAINANKALLYYPQVLPLDLVIARVLLEAATIVSVFIIVLGGDALWQGSFAIDSMLRTLVGLGLVCALGASLGLIFCAASVYSNVVQQIQGPLLRPMFWLSGVFFTANDLPTPALNILKWNPVLHAVEMVRDGWYPSYTSRVADPAYAIFWILGLSFVGLNLERMARRRLQF